MNKQNENLCKVLTIQREGFCLKMYSYLFVLTIYISYVLICMYDENNCFNTFLTEISSWCVRVICLLSVHKTFQK